MVRVIATRDEGTYGPLYDGCFISEDERISLNQILAYESKEPYLEWPLTRPEPEIQPEGIMEKILFKIAMVIRFLRRR